MVTNAVKWATEKGLVRTNPVHGAKEYRVAVFEKFNNKERDRTATSATVGAEVQDPLYISRFIVDIFQSHDRFTRYISINDKKIYDIYIYIYIQMIIYIYDIHMCVFVAPGTCWVQIDWQDASAIFTDAPHLTNERAMMQHDLDEPVTFAIHPITHFLFYFRPAISPGHRQGSTNPGCGVAPAQLPGATKRDMFPVLQQGQCPCSS